jgi:hypothetical protein
MTKKSKKRFFNLIALATFKFALVSTALAVGPTDKAGVVTLLGSLVSWAIDIFWVVAVGAVVWAAFLFLTAGDDAEKVTKAKKMLVYAVIAGIVVLLANGIDKIATSLLS